MYLLVFDSKREMAHIVSTLRANGEIFDIHKLKRLLDEINYSVILAFMNSNEQGLDKRVLSNIYSSLDDKIVETVYYTLKEMEITYPYNYLTEDSKGHVRESVDYWFNSKKLDKSKITDDLLNSLCSVAIKEFIENNGYFSAAKKSIANNRDKIYDKLFMCKLANDEEGVREYSNKYSNLICAGMILNDLKKINSMALDAMYIKERGKYLEAILDISDDIDDTADRETDIESKIAIVKETTGVRMDNIYDYLISNM